MLFNSIDFAVFLPIVFVVYWFLVNRNLKIQNLFIVFASYVFYGWWDWRFLFLMFFSSILDYIVGLALKREQRQKIRKIYLFTTILFNLAILGYFKYYNFFVDSFISAFSFFGFEFQARSLNVILPVGISFYTFQSMSYGIDVYRRKLEPTRDIICYSAFVSFFPQLVAGPIERATNLLPQFYKKRVFDYNKAVDGMRQILWGLFKKIVIADGCAEFANEIFNNSESYSGSTLVLGAFFFTFQIYCDFSGYSDIAIGVARLFGFDLMRNFNYPYFSRDMAEFWRRWHISLSTWFRDYLYFPLGGSRRGTLKNVRNIFIIFIVSGFWHGANWTFVIWGALNAIYFLPLLLTGKNRDHLDIIANDRNLPSLKEFGSMTITFILTVLAWIFFRAESVDHAFSYIIGIFSHSLFAAPDFPGIRRAAFIVLFVILFMIIEWHGRREQFAIAKLGLKLRRPFRYAMYYAILLIIYFFGGKEQQFIYFQF